MINKTKINIFLTKIFYILFIHSLVSNYTENSDKKK